MSFFDRLNELAGMNCASCGEDLPRGASSCPACQALVLDEEDLPRLDLLAGPASARRAFANRARNLERLLSDLEALERGEGRLEHALDEVDALLEKLRRWDASMADCQEGERWAPEEVQMHREYREICARLLTGLDAYRTALESGRLELARARTLPLEEAFGLLKELREHYKSLGFA